MRRTALRHRMRAGETGVALFVVLIFLLVLTVLGLTAMRAATLGERIASNRVDKALATQAAEAALRDAERDIRWQRADGSYCKRANGTIVRGCRDKNHRPLPEKIHNFGGTTGNCVDGQCYHLPTAYFTTPVWEDPAMWDKAVEYGRYTGAPRIAAVDENSQPKRFPLGGHLRQRLRQRPGRRPARHRARGALCRLPEQEKQPEQREQQVAYARRHGTG